MKPIAIDLFSGCGGLTLGLQQAGFRVKGAVEIDPLAVETYNANHKGVHVWATDIRSLSIAEVMRKLTLRRGQLHLLAGCPPCQGFSTMTTLNGSIVEEDSRNDLVFQFIRFVRGLRPKTVMMENVPGLAKDRRFQQILTQLEEMGYCCNHDVLDAADYGVPQRRRRFILIASRKKKILFAQLARRRRTVREAFDRLGKRAKHDPLHNLPQQRSEKIRKLIRLIPKRGKSKRFG